MRKIAFGYSTFCNIRCSHCVAAQGDVGKKMELSRAKEIIRELAVAGVGGISFSAGEPLLYLDDLVQLLEVCTAHKMYTRVVTNSFWAKDTDSAQMVLSRLASAGICQVRLSFSRWHQQHVPRENIVRAVGACQDHVVDCFVSFVTDFSEEDDVCEQYLRDKELKFFPEPVIYSGRAGCFERKKLFTDYQENLCAMNPYIDPKYDMYACCDAGSHFTNTNFFYLGNLKDHSVDYLFSESENSKLYNCIRHMGITSIASFMGYKARDIITYRKCELCKLIFDSPENLKSILSADGSKLFEWWR